MQIAKFSLESIRSPIIGSYHIKDGSHKIIGRSQGQKLDKKFIDLDFYKSKTAYQIIKRTMGRYFIFLNDEVQATFKVFNFSTQAELRIDGEEIIHFYRKKGDMALTILQDSSEIGIATNTHTGGQIIGIALKNEEHQELILCALVSLAIEFRQMG